MEAYSVQCKGNDDPFVRETLIGTANDDHKKWGIELRRRTNKGSPQVGPCVEMFGRRL